MTPADLALLLDHPGYQSASLRDHVRFREWVRAGTPVLPLLSVKEHQDLHPQIRTKYDQRRVTNNFHPPLVPTPLVTLSVRVT